MGKLLNIIKVLTLVQKRDLKYFINLPSNKIINRDKVIFNTLLDLKASTIERKGENVWESLLSKEEQKNKNRIKNRLLKVVERYISLISLESNNAVRYYLLADYYSRNQIQKNINATLKKGISELQENYRFDDKVFLFWLYQLSILREKDIRRPDEKIDLMYAALNDFYLCNKIRVISEKINRHKIINEEHDFKNDFREIEHLIKHSNAPEVEVYSALFKLLKDGDEVYFEALDKSLAIYQSYFKAEYLKEIYVYVLNYCIKKINAGRLDYAHKYLRYIKNLESRDLLLENNHLGIGRFKNSILCSVIIGETKWATEFINKYSDYLSQPSLVDRKAFLILNKAIVAFYNNDIDAAFDQIIEFQNSRMYNKDLYYRITCDKLLLKVFYELNQEEAVRRKIESIKTFLRTQKRLNEQRIQKHLNFLKIVQRLLTRQLLDTGVQNELLIPDYIWLEKIRKRNGD